MSSKSCAEHSRRPRHRSRAQSWADMPSEPPLLLASGERGSVRTKCSRAQRVRARKLARAFWWGARAALSASPGLRPDRQWSRTRTRGGNLPSAAPSCYLGSKAGEKVNLKGHSFNSEAGAPDLTSSVLESTLHSRNVRSTCKPWRSTVKLTLLN